jgi:hypothetical protein
MSMTIARPGDQDRFAGIIVGQLDNYQSRGVVAIEVSSTPHTPLILELIPMMMHQVIFAAACLVGSAVAQDAGIVLEGQTGPGRGKHIVFVTGDEEYRSEEGMPQMAKILARHHGFRCTVLFAINKDTGDIDPETVDHIPGLEALASADLMVIFTRFRDLPDEQMKHIVDYVDSGRPIVGLRTATHAFHVKKHTTYAHYDFHSKSWPDGFGRQVLGETWINHHGGHGTESTRGIAAPGSESHPILRGITNGDVWDPSDVYGVRLPMMDGIQPVLMGQVLAGMAPDDKPLQPTITKDGQVVNKNSPMMPLAWIRSFASMSGRKARVFATTLGTSQGLARAGTRRLLVNACYWTLRLEQHIRPDSSVDIVGVYTPSPFGFKAHKRGVKPKDHLAP